MHRISLKKYVVVRLGHFYIKGVYLLLVFFFKFADDKYLKGLRLIYNYYKFRGNRYVPEKII